VRNRTDGEGARRVRVAEDNGGMWDRPTLGIVDGEPVYVIGRDEDDLANGWDTGDSGLRPRCEVVYGIILVS